MGGHLADAVREVRDARRAGRLAARAGRRRNGASDHGQSRRDHRPRAQQRPLLLVASDPAIARRHTRGPTVGVHVRGRPRRRRPAHPRPQCSRGRRRALHRDRQVPAAGEVAAILRERLGEAARKVPSRVAPDLLIRAMALFDGNVRSIVGDLAKRSWFSSEKARTTLGWSTRPIEDSIEDCARSLL